MSEIPLDKLAISGDLSQTLSLKFAITIVFGELLVNFHFKRHIVGDGITQIFDVISDIKRHIIDSD